MSYAAQTDRYLENDILSRPKEWLVPLLFEHLVASLKRAGVQVEIGDRAGWTRSLNRASAIVFELLSTLDVVEGGELARRLSSLYVFWTSEILDLCGNPDARRLAALVEMAEMLHDAFEQAAETVSPRGAARVQLLHA